MQLGTIISDISGYDLPWNVQRDRGMLDTTRAEAGPWHFVRAQSEVEHLLLLGGTGSGKTTLMRFLKVADTSAGHGLAYIDPHGDAARTLLNHIPPNRMQDVIYFSPAETEQVIALNFLETVPEQYRAAVAEHLVAAFKYIWRDSWGERMEWILLHAFRAHLDLPEGTLLGVRKMLRSKSYRKWILPYIQDDLTQEFWTEEFESWTPSERKEAVMPILNRLDKILGNKAVRNILGQSKSTISLRHIMDERKILVVNLSSGKIGPRSCELLGALLVAKFFTEALTREDTDEEDRIPFYLYVDEWKKFQTAAFADILSESRKYKLGLTLAGQYLGQAGEEMVDALLNNMNDIFCFKVGSRDAKLLAPDLDIPARALMQLAPYEIRSKTSSAIYRLAHPAILERLGWRAISCKNAR
jgi:energy-coupling factor transporter ATP-binding protein EcfA2